jgi:hypothetical protein
MKLIIESRCGRYACLCCVVVSDDVDRECGIGGPDGGEI